MDRNTGEKEFRCNRAKQPPAPPSGPGRIRKRKCRQMKSPITRRDALKRIGAGFAGLSMAGAGLSCSEKDSSPASRISQTLERRPYNIVIISIDSLRADRLGCYGYFRNISPRIDRFARNCFQFENAFSASPWTVPSYYALLTGLYPLIENNAIRPYFASSDHPSLTDFFHRHGYETVLFTEENSFFKHKIMGFEKRFQRIISAQSRWDPDRYYRIARSVKYLLERDRPFLAFVYTNDVHYPYRREGLAEFLDVSSGKELEKHPSNGVGGLRRPMENFPLNSAYYNASYDAGVHFVDRQLQDLFETLEASGAMENTVILLTADHGEILDDPGRKSEIYYSHISPYDANLRVPFLLHVPNCVPPPSMLTAQIQLTDVLETLGDLTGLKDLPPSHGKSILPLLEGTQEAIRPYSIAFHHHSRYPWSMIRTPDYKLILSREEKKDPTAKKRQEFSWPKDELYRYTDDTQEILNRIEEQRLLGIHEDLRSALGKSEQALVVNGFSTPDGESRPPSLNEEGIDTSLFNEEEINRLRNLGYLQ